MSIQLKRGQTINLNTAHAEVMRKVNQRPIETTRDAIKRNDLIAMYNAIKVFGIKV